MPKTFAAACLAVFRLRILGVSAIKRSTNWRVASSLLLQIMRPVSDLYQSRFEPYADATGLFLVTETVRLERLRYSPER
jgi:hypothetical protein